MQALRQADEMMTELTALLADPAQHELAADEVVPDLFWCVPFGVQEECQGKPGKVRSLVPDEGRHLVSETVSKLLPGGEIFLVVTQKDCRD